MDEIERISEEIINSGKIEKDYGPQRPCPHCGKMVGERHSRCPRCHWRLHWVRETAVKWLEYLQSPMNNEKMDMMLWLAIVGQALFYVTDQTIHQYIPMIPTPIFMMLGHIVKGVGETALFYCLMHGLLYEFRSMKYHCKIIFVLLILYHSFALFWNVISFINLPFQFLQVTYWTGVGLMVAMEVFYMALGVRLYRKYNGGIATVGILMLITQGLHFYLSLALEIVSKNFISDTLLFAVTIGYIYYLRNHLLEHNEYKRLC